MEYGNAPQSVLCPDTSPVCSISIVNKSPDSSNFSVMDVDVIGPHIGGDRTNNLLVAMREAAQTGQRQVTFVDDYYYRVHVDPFTFPLGPVLSPVEETFIVWNAWFETKNCSAINKTNPDEFTLTGLTAPFNLKALEYTTFTIDVPIEGSLEFTSTITFVFPGESPVVTITGQRVKIFPWTPLVPLLERLQWYTEVLTGKDGSEQRISHRPAPRQGFNAKFYFDSEEAQAKFDAALFQWQKLTWGLPIWAEYVLHTATITAGDTVISVDTSEGDFRPDSLALIWQDEDTYEAVKIDTIDSSGLILEREVQNTFTGNKWIMPLRQAHMITPPKKSAAPDGYAYTECDFLVRDNAALTGYTPAVEYDGVEVLTTDNFVDEGQEEKSDAGYAVADYGHAVFDFFSDSDFNAVNLTHKFMRFAKANCWDFRLFLHSLFGRRGTIWVPSYKADLTQTQTIGAADVNFSVANIGLAENMGVNVMRTHLAFVFPDGSELYREITGITESGSEEIITIDSSLGQEVAVGGCEISFLDKYRLSSDKVEITWEKQTEMSCRLSLVRVSQ
jgi:hypothetical protein